MAECTNSSLENEDMSTSVEEQLNEIKSERRSIEGFITRYILNTRTVTDDEKMKRVAFGVKQNKPHKTILLVGETGTGKSTLINTMVTCMLGVKSKDRMWFEVIETKEKQTVSQTQAVTVYDGFTEHCPFSLTIIDTPGFGNTEGKKDLNVAKSLLELFSSNDGVHEIDAVCLVITSIMPRLTERHHYIFNAVLSLFGNDVEKNTVLFITHAAKKPNNAIKLVKKSKIPCALTAKGEPVYFRFDNSHCENFNDEEISADYQASWNLLNTTMENFLSFLKESKPISVKMTVAVLRSRKQLTASVYNIKDKIILTEQKQKELEQTKEALQEHEKEIRDNDNFEYEVDEVYKVKVPLEYKWWHFGWKEATCCSVCEENCHYPGCWWVTDLSRCSVMDEGKCTVCTGRCHYTDHVKEGKKYVSKTRKVKKTKEDLKMKYMMKSDEMKSLMSQIENDMKEMEKEKIRLVEECYQHVVKLEDIALKRDSVFTLKHLDFLIEKVKETGKPDQVQKLQDIKSRADIQLFATNDYWPMLD
ncbi:uncharacterized protein LOC113648199 isoform X2 [Tachysurus fulvidraco]|uniref:uncharacterized protein LOC113648199 isoform X2 n=1 Tax=Tachysurus fulvidraco TaxID=1234273 RepID=UPI001FEF1AF0|nr:uncharacterized protein LOC113648199 isoform X2 [Tachysurus fulvidraco]